MDLCPFYISHPLCVPHPIWPCLWSRACGDLKCPADSFGKVAKEKEMKTVWTLSLWISVSIVFVISFPIYKVITYVFQWLARGLWPQQYYQSKSWIASFKQVFKEQKYTLWVNAAELESFWSSGDGTLQKETVAANHLILHHFAIVTLPVRQKISPSGWDKLLVFSNSHWVLSLLTLHDVNYAQLVLARLRLL